MDCSYKNELERELTFLSFPPTHLCGTCVTDCSSPNRCDRSWKQQSYWQSRLLQRHPVASRENDRSAPPARRAQLKACKTILCVQKVLFLPSQIALCYKSWKKNAEEQSPDVLKRAWKPDPTSFPPGLGLIEVDGIGHLVSLMASLPGP